MNRTGPSSDRTPATKNGTRRNSSKLDQQRNPQEETSRQKIPDLLQRSVQRHPHIVLPSHHAISSPRQRLSSVGKESTTQKILDRGPKLSYCIPYTGVSGEVWNSRFSALESNYDARRRHTHTHTHTRTGPSQDPRTIYIHTPVQCQHPSDQPPVQRFDCMCFSAFRICSF